MSGSMSVVTVSGVWLQTLDFPKISWGKGRYELDGAAIQDLLDDLYDKTVVVGMETVNAGATQSRLTAFSFGAAYATVRQICRASRFSLWMVRPQEWKREFGLIKASKDDGISVATALFPDSLKTIGRNHNRADSLMIAEYTRRVYEFRMMPRRVGGK